MAHGEISESDVFLMSRIRLWWLFVPLLIKSIPLCAMALFII